MSNTEKVSIIVPTRDRKDQLIACLRSLYRQTQSPDEIIVVDNSNNQTAKDSVAYCQKLNPHIRYYHEPRLGSPCVRNRGINLATNDLLAFIDDDCIADRNWVEEILRSQGGKKELVLQGKNLNGLQNNIYACVEHYYTEFIFQSRFYQQKGIIYSLGLDTKNFSIRKSLIKKHRTYFDKVFSPFSIYEDIDFADQIRKYGMNIVYNHKMIVTHYGRGTLINHVRREFKKGRASFHYIMKREEILKKNLQIKQFLEKNDFWKTIIDKKEAKEKKLKMKLRKEILYNKKLMFILSFKLLLYLTIFLIKTGYYYERINQCFKKFSPSAARNRLSKPSRPV